MSSRRTLARIAATTAVAVCLSAGVAEASRNPGAVFLLIWPTARTTALAGAMTGLADDQDAACWNPGGLGFQQSLGGCLSGGSWLPGLYPGMYYTYASAGYGTVGILPGGRNLNVGLDYIYLTTGETDVVDEHGNFLGRYTTYDRAIGLHAGAQVTQQLGVGTNVKFIQSYLVPDWIWQMMPELGIDAGGTGNDVAVDLGALYQPAKYAGIGLTLVNIGPNIAYTSSGETDPLPLVLRIGGCLTPLDDQLFRVRVLLEADKILVGAFYDTTNTKPFGRKLNEELRDAWKSVAFEATFLQLFAIRAGYFEDLTGQRGGIVMRNRDGNTYHYGLGDVLTRRNLGVCRSIGVCWGIAFCYKDHVRLDVSSDAAIYDFPTSNTKVSLTVNDVVGMYEDLTSGRLLDWMP
jgi:hypothetical protein